MSSKEDILKKYRANIRQQFDMPDLSDIRAITYPDPLLQFMNMVKSAGGNAGISSKDNSTAYSGTTVSGGTEILADCPYGVTLGGTVSGGTTKNYVTTGGTVTGNEVTDAEGGAIGVGSTSARLYFTGNANITEEEIKANQELQDQINAEIDQIDWSIYANPDTPEYQAMVDEIRKELGLTTLKFQKLDDLVEAIGLPKCKLCTHCFDGSSWGHK